MADSILIVDDDPSILESVTLGLEAVGFVVASARSASEALDALARGPANAPGEPFALLITDLHLGDDNGLALTAKVRDLHPDLPVIVMTGQATVRSAIEAMRAGVWDYLVKPLELDELELQARRAIRHTRLTREVQDLRRDAASAGVASDLLGQSPALGDLVDLIARVARTDVGVLLLGESGTGKEVVARRIHDHSARADGAFVAVNCAALPETLLESELFGHVRGAFTDAKKARRGLFLEANGGTLFLDEIGEMPLSMQPKLLRALQERVVRPVGGDEAIPFDTRVIAASNRDLAEAVQQKTFREDLYYRLNVVQIDLPPLRARGNDILILAQAFIERFAERHKVPVRGLSSEAAQKLLQHGWPGNVRELMNAIERGVALARGELLQLEDLPERVREAEKQRIDFAADDPDDLVTLEELERRYIVKVLAAAGGNKTLAARILGVDRKTLFRKLKREDATDAGEASESGEAGDAKPAEPDASKPLG